MRALCNRDPEFVLSICATGISLTHFQMSKLLNEVSLSEALNILTLVTESIFPVTCFLLPLA